MGFRKYTFVCEYRGGTYVAQVSAEDLSKAIRAWADYLISDEPIPRVSALVAKEVAAQIDDSGPTELEGLIGVWCISAIVGGDYLLANIVDTAQATIGK